MPEPVFDHIGSWVDTLYAVKKTIMKQYIR
jgi:hypothetical protein